MRSNKQNHLDVVGMSYLTHLFRAWSIAIVLIVHGLLPNVWKQKASQMMNDSRENSEIE